MKTYITLSMLVLLCACGVKGSLDRPQPEQDEQRQPIGRY